MLNYGLYKNALHQFSREMLKEHYPKHAETIERIGYYFPTEKDVQQVSQLFSDIYSNAYQQCVEHHKNELAKLGLLAQITPQNKA